MDAPGDLWASLYFVPVIGVFALAGAVYYLSFRSKGDEDNQSLRIYLNVLSGDDDRNRKAAKKFRKFGTLSNGGAKPQQRLTPATGSGIDGEGDDGKQVESEKEKRPVAVESPSTRKPSQLSSKKTDPSAGTIAYSSAPAAPPIQLEYSVHVTPNSQVPEVVNGNSQPAAGVSTSPDADHSIESGNVTGWHKAVSRKEKKYEKSQESKTAAEDATNHSTTSDESRPSFRHSNSSRTSSPIRSKTVGHQSSAYTSERRKFANRKTLAKPPHSFQRPAHLKLQPASSSTGSTAAGVVVRPVQPPLAKTPEASQHVHLILSGSSSFRIIPPIHSANDHVRISVVPPGQTDICIQTEEDEEYPTPLQGLRQVDAGKPRFVICHDFQMQVDLDTVAENSSESESELRFEDGDKILYSSGASLSSGEGSSRVTPVLEDEYTREFSATAEKSQGVHRKNQGFYNNRMNPRQAPQNGPYRYPENVSQNSDGKRGGVYYVGQSDLPRTCRDLSGENGSSDWIDNSSRRGRAPLNGRWRN